MDFDNTELLRTLSALPPAPPKPDALSVWGAGRGLVKAVPALASDVVAFGSEAATASWRGLQRMATADREEMRKMDRAGALKEEDFSNAYADTVRDRSKELFTPDPVTAHTAEQVVFSASKAIGKVVGYSMVAGPAGIPLAAADEAASVSDDLKRKGVDFGTRSKVGVLSGIALAGGAALPMYAGTVKGTVALYLAGGPGGFVAQQEATRSILESANYHEIAKSYDPLDPVGLTISALIPLPFAGYGIARARAGRSKPAPAPVKTAPDAMKTVATPEQVDAAMAHNLTLLRDAHDGVTASGELPTARAPEAFPTSLLNTDGLPNRGRELVQGRAETLAASLRESGFEVTVDHSGSAAGPSSYLRIVDPETGRFLQQQVRISGHSKGQKESQAVWNVATDEEFTAVLRAAEDMRSQGPSAGMLEIQAKEAEAAQKLLERAQRRRAEGLKLTKQERAALDAQTPQTASDLTAQRAFGQQWQEIAQAAGKNDLLRNIIDGLRQSAPDMARLQELMTAGARQPMDFGGNIIRAVKELDGLAARGGTLEEFIAKGEMQGARMTPEVQNLLIGLSENASNPARVAELVRRMVASVDNLGDPRKGGFMQDGPSAADLTADAVERMRALTDKDLAGIEAKPKAHTDALMDSVSTRVADVEATAPDMVLRQNEDGTPVTVAQELERIRREAIEGTDSELGAADADLVAVAANCALLQGA